MTDTVVVRIVDFARRADAAAYLQMLDAYARDPMGAGHPLPDTVRDRVVRDLAAIPGAHCLLAEQHGEPIGFATCFVGYSTFNARPLLNIHDIAVVPAARGRGVAKALLAAITDVAHRLECCRLTLEVRQDNEVAQRVYARDGFEPAACGLFMEKAL
jgi:ribosomal protein S18 acetylase RimI-like enzyme